jgi:hypothetical protein
VIVCRFAARCIADYLRITAGADRLLAALSYILGSATSTAP